MVVGVNNPIHDTAVWLRDSLLSSVTDHISASRPTRSKFVVTNHPQRDVFYPLITVKVFMNGDRTAGVGTEGRITNIGFEIRIWSKSVKEKDELADATYTALRG